MPLTGAERMQVYRTCMSAEKQQCFIQNCIMLKKSKLNLVFKEISRFFKKQ